MRTKRLKVFLPLEVVVVILVMFLSACGGSAPLPATDPLLTKSSPTPAIPATETLLPSPTPDVRPRLVTSNGEVLWPDVEINATNFKKVKLLGTLGSAGSGTPVVIEFSPDDTLLAVGTSVGDVQIYDAHHLNLIQTIQTKLLLQFPVTSGSTICNPCGRLAFSPDNKSLGVLSVDGNLQIWSLESKQQIASSTERFIAEIAQRRLAGEETSLTNWRSIRFSDDNSYVGIFLEPIWWPPNYCPLSNEQCGRNYRTSYFILSVSGSLWCGEFTCPTSSSKAIQNDLSQFKDAFTFAPEIANLPVVPLPKDVNGKNHYRGKSYLKPQYLSIDGSQALAFDLYGTVNNFPQYGNTEVIYAGTLWNVANNQTVNNFSFPYVEIYSFSHDLTAFAYSDSVSITVFDIPSGLSRGAILLAKCPGNLTFSPDGKILVGYYRSGIYFCDPLTGDVTRTISVPTGFISSIAFSPDGNYIASTGQTWGNYLSTSKANYDPFVYIWNTSDGKLVATLEHQGDTMIVKFSPDGKYIATGAGVYRACSGVTSPKDERFVLWSWDGRNATKIKEQEFYTGIANLAFSPDSQKILLATNEAYACTRTQSHIYLHDIANDVLSQSSYAMKRTDPPTFLQFFPDGMQFLASAGWEAARVSIPAFSSTDYYVSYQHQEYSGAYPSPNWSVVASPMTSSNSIKIGDITYSNQINVPGDFTYTSLVFSPDGKVIYGNANIIGIISVWGIPVAE